MTKKLLKDLALATALVAAILGGLVLADGLRSQAAPQSARQSVQVSSASNFTYEQAQSAFPSMRR
jgi:hypothetical protein